MTTFPQDATEFTARRDSEQRRSYARRPKRIADVMAQVITQRGYGRVEANAALDSAWREAAGEWLAQASRPGQLRRGRLEIVVTNSTTIQELGFEKQRILAELERLMPDVRIAELRFRVGAIQ